MAEPFLGEIRMFAGNYAPAGWLFCNGQLLAIAENSALFSLIGTTYGGDGVRNFAVPDLRGRAPLHQGPGYALGANGGSETVAVTAQQLPAHSHGAQGSTAGNAAGPVGNFWSTDPGGNVAKYYKVPPAPDGQMNASAVGPAGGGQPHQNMQPFLTISYIISLSGIYPSQG